MRKVLNPVPPSNNFKIFKYEAPVIAGEFCEGVVAFAFGDGMVSLISLKDFSADNKKICDGAVLSLARHYESGFIAGDDEGKITRILPGGKIEVLEIFKGKWIENLATSDRLKMCAASAGKELHVFGERKFLLKDHPSTITGIAFSPKGRRLAVSHYNGVTLWALEKKPSPERLVHKGSHIALTWIPDGSYVVTATQEMMIKIWRVLGGNDSLFMSGYNAKVKSFAWNKKSNLLATSGADQIVCWDFSGKGPAGREPATVGPGGDLVCAVTFHPERNVVAAGMENGMIIIADMDTREWFPLKTADGNKIETLLWSPNSEALLFGDENGNHGVVLMR